MFVGVVALCYQHHTKGLCGVDNGDSRVLAGCFVMECEKVIVLGIYKKNSRKVCGTKNSLRCQTKSGSWQPCGKERY